MREPCALDRLRQVFGVVHDDKLAARQTQRVVQSLGLGAGATIRHRNNLEIPRQIQGLGNTSRFEIVALQREQNLQLGGGIVYRGKRPHQPRQDFGFTVERNQDAVDWQACIVRAFIDSPGLSPDRRTQQFGNGAAANKNDAKERKSKKCGKRRDGDFRGNKHTTDHQPDKADEEENLPERMRRARGKFLGPAPQAVDGDVHEGRRALPVYRPRHLGTGGENEPLPARVTSSSDRAQDVGCEAPRLHGHDIPAFKNAGHHARPWWIGCCGRQLREGCTIDRRQGHMRGDGTDVVGFRNPADRDQHLMGGHAPLRSQDAGAPQRGRVDQACQKKPILFIKGRPLCGQKPALAYAAQAR